MSTHSVSQPYVLPERPNLQLLKGKPEPASTAAIRLAFWTVGILLAAAQAWVYRFKVTPDSISYLDMSDGVLPGGDWHRLINGIWSPLYPFLIGLARRMFPLSSANEIAEAHLLNIAVFIFAFAGSNFSCAAPQVEEERSRRPRPNLLYGFFFRDGYISGCCLLCFLMGIDF